MSEPASRLHTVATGLKEDTFYVVFLSVLLPQGDAGRGFLSRDAPHHHPEPPTDVVHPVRPERRNLIGFQLFFWV